MTELTLKELRESILIHTWVIIQNMNICNMTDRRCVLFEAYQNGLFFFVNRCNEKEQDGQRRYLQILQNYGNWTTKYIANVDHVELEYVKDLSLEYSKRIQKGEIL